MDFFFSNIPMHVAIAKKSPIKILSNTTRKKKNIYVSKSSKAGLLFPVGRIAKYLKQGEYSKRINDLSAIYMCAVLEYLVAEVIELSGDVTKKYKKKRITPRHILLGIKNDTELNLFCNNVIIAFGGVQPNINSALLKKQFP